MKPELRDWLDRQPKKRLYWTGNTKHLRSCLLCGNRYPYTPRWFARTGEENVRGFVNDGLMQVCLDCVENWADPDSRVTCDDGVERTETQADIRKLHLEALNKQRSGKRGRIKPLAERKPSKEDVERTERLAAATAYDNRRESHFRNTIYENDGAE